MTNDKGSSADDKVAKLDLKKQWAMPPDAPAAKKNAPAKKAAAKKVAAKKTVGNSVPPKKPRRQREARRRR